jgi:hypothetical protein
LTSKKTIVNLNVKKISITTSKLAFKVFNVSTWIGLGTFAVISRDVKLLQDSLPAW